MSSDIPSHGENAEGGGEQPRKRTRKSGWDIPGPAGVPPSTLIPTIPAVSAVPATQPANTLEMQQAALLRARQAVLSLGLAGVPISAPKPGCRVYIGSIHYDLKESDIVALFSSFGTVTKSEMQIDPLTNRPKGFCFLEFAEQSQAEAAMAMDGFELAGRRIKVGKPTHTGNQSAAAPNPITAALSLPALGIVPATVGGQPILTPSAIAQQALLNLNASLASSEILSCVLVKNVTAQVTIDALRPIFQAFGTVKRILFVEDGRVPDTVAGTRSVVIEYESPLTAKTTVEGLHNFPLGGANLSCSTISLGRANELLDVDTSTFQRVVLEDMVTYEDTLDAGLEEEISEEARNYGTLDKVEINVADDKEVTVVLHYAEPAHAAKALKALNGRAFGGKKIKAVLAK